MDCAAAARQLVRGVTAVHAALAALASRTPLVRPSSSTTLQQKSGRLLLVLPILHAVSSESTLACKITLVPTTLLLFAGELIRREAEWTARVERHEVEGGRIGKSVTTRKVENVSAENPTRLPAVSSIHCRGMSQKS
jgi:hypothetical protein